MSQTITHTNLPNLFHRGKVRDTYDIAAWASYSD